MFNNQAPCWIALGLSLTTLSAQAQLSYDLDIVAIEGETIDGLMLTDIFRVDVSQNGTAAFVGRVPGSSSGTPTVFTSTDPGNTPFGAVLSTNTPVGGGTLDGFAFVSISVNDSGNVAVVFDDNNQIYSTADGVVVPAGATIGGLTIDTPFEVDPGIHYANDGTVYFTAETTTGIKALFTQSTVLLTEGQTLNGQTVGELGSGNNENLDVNAAGQIALIGNPSGSDRQALTDSQFFTQSGGTLNDGTAVVFINAADVGIDGAGTPYFYGGFGPGSDLGLATPDGVLFSDGDTIEGTPIDFGFGEFDVAEDGTVVFANFDASFDIEGVYTLDRSVARVGDVIDGLTFTNLVSTQDLRIADNGDIFFIAELDDAGTTRSALVRATLVPEPTSLALLALGGLFVARRQRSA
ncbi:MAG: PEP-CTERM sorting domain-containing protein [Planctomycetota bacterium]